MGPWLLMIIALLIVACVALYFQARQVQSEARGTQSFIADELRDAEAGLVSALERIQRMDSVLSAREQAIAAAGSAAPDAVASTAHAFAGAGAARARVGGDQPEAPSPEPLAPTGAHAAQTQLQTALPSVDEGARGPAEEDTGAALDQKPTGSTLSEWRSRAVGLAVAGLTPLQIARELELPVGEVELALALGTWNGTATARPSVPASPQWH